MLMTVIYVDVLFIVNFFITFFLLLVTAKLSKRDDKLGRCVLASFIGGLYSLVILWQNLNFAASFIGKLAAACIIVIFIFVGVMVGFWLIFKPKGIIINNSTVYFNVSARALLISAFIAYILSALIIRIYNGKTAAKELYSVTVFKNERRIRFFAFADSGNNLKEPFSDYPVIIAQNELFDGIDCRRLVPFNTIGGEGVLFAFKPDRVEISSSTGNATVENVYIALSDKVKKGEYQGILNPKILNI